MVGSAGTLSMTTPKPSKPSRSLRPCHLTLTVIDLLKLVLESQALTWIV
jgi:hypothetical protein